MFSFDDKHRNSKDSGVTVTTIEAEGGIEIKQAEKNPEYFEKALKLTKFGRFNYFIIVVSGLILTNVLLETLGVSFILPVSECDLELSVQEKGILSGIGYIGIISSSYLWGFLADTTGRKKVIQPTLIIGFILTVLSSFANSFWLLVTLRYINGFCISGGSATVYAYLGEFHTSKTRSRAIMGAAFIFGLSSMMLPMIAWLVINQQWSFVVPFLNITYKPWRLFMVVCGIPGLVCGLCLFKIPESPKFLLANGSDEKALKILKMMYTQNTGKSPEEYPVDSVLEDIDSAMRPKLKVDKSNAAAVLLKSMWDQTAPLFNREYIRSIIIVCSIQFWIFFTSNGMYMWFPEILNSLGEFMKEHYNPNNTTFICEVIASKHTKLQQLLDHETNECVETLELSTFQHSLFLEVLYAVGFAVIGFIIKYVGQIEILFVVTFGCGVCGIIALYVDVTFGIYFFTILLLCGLAINVLSVATVDLFPTRLRALAVCISLMMGRLGSVVGANVFGALLYRNCHAAFYVSGISLILAGCSGFFIPKPPKGSTDTPRRVSLISMTGN